MCDDSDTIAQADTASTGVTVQARSKRKTTPVQPIWHLGTLPISTRASRASFRWLQACLPPKLRLPEVRRRVPASLSPNLRAYACDRQCETQSIRARKRRHHAHQITTSQCIPQSGQCLGRCPSPTWVCRSRGVFCSSCSAS